MACVVMVLGGGVRVVPGMNNHAHVGGVRLLGSGRVERQWRHGEELQAWW